MRFTVVALRRAERDYTAILEYIASRSVGGAQAWARAFDTARVPLPCRQCFPKRNLLPCSFASVSVRFFADRAVPDDRVSQFVSFLESLKIGRVTTKEIAA